jgi:glycosyltransferase involved in cell wall biosynthesis
MPCLNESETINKCVREALLAIRESGFTGEVIVADNGSSDDSADIARKAGARTVHILSKGYGSALQGGITAAQGKYILMGDADGSYDFRELPRFLVKLAEGYDLVVGCRFPNCGGRIASGAMPWKHRWIGNPVLSALGKLFFSSPVDDFHCGLRAFRRESILALGLKTHGMEFASEMVVKASLQGLQITQVPITLRKDGRSRPPHLRSWRDGWRHLRFMLLYSPLWLFIYPGIFLTISGLIGFIMLRSAPVRVGAITFDLNSLLVSSTAVLIGFQVLCFGLFIKAYAVNSGLLPGKNFWLRLVKGRPVEWGICIGVLFAFAGTGALIQEVLTWKSVGFGALSYQSSLRSVITAVTGIGLGIQAMVYGFALAIIGLER